MLSVSDFLMGSASLVTSHTPALMRSLSADFPPILDGELSTDAFPELSFTEGWTHCRDFLETLWNGKDAEMPWYLLEIWGKIVLIRIMHLVLVLLETSCTVIYVEVAVWDRMTGRFGECYYCGTRRCYSLPKNEWKRWIIWEYLENEDLEMTPFGKRWPVNLGYAPSICKH